MTVFCDLDGTLIDSSRRHVVLLKRLLKHYADTSEIPEYWEPDDYLAFKADGCNTKSYLLVHNVPVLAAQKIAADWADQIESDALLELDGLYTDSLGFLERIQQQGHDIVYVSARKNKEGAYKSLRRLGLADFAKDVFIVNPHNAAQAKVDAVASCTFESAVFIGDTEADRDCATALNMPSFLLNRGFRSRKYWDQRQVKSYADLQGIFDEIMLCAHEQK